MTTEHTSVPLAALRESPFNPRKAYPVAELTELAESIKSQGVMQPILIRPINVGQTDVEHRYEIIFGHRRYRASLQAGMESIPVQIREMSDEAAAIAQVHENAKRQNVSPMEEAESFANLTKEHKLSVDQIAAAVGMSRSFVYGRMRLTRAAPEVKQACNEEGLGGEIAQLLVSHIPNHDLQRKSLQNLRTYNYTAEGKVPSGWVSYRDAKNLLRGMFSTDLEAAPFDLSDAKLAKRAGACTTCPKRAGNAPDLEGLLEPSICTDKACYDVKAQAHSAQQVIVFRKQGSTVIDGDEAAKLYPHQYSGPVGYTELRTFAFSDESANEEDLSELDFGDVLKRLGDQAPKITYIANPHKANALIPCITDAEASAALRACGVDDDGDPLPHSSAARAAEKSEPNWLVEQRERTAARRAAMSPEERAVDDNDYWSHVREQILAKVTEESKRTNLELLLVARVLTVRLWDADAVIEAMGWSAEIADEDPDEEIDWIQAKLGKISPAALARFVVLIAVRAVDEDTPANEKVELAKAYDVNVLDIVTPAKKLAVHCIYSGGSDDEEQKDDAGVAGGSDAQAELVQDAQA